MRLIRASLMQIPFSVRSKRQLMEQMQYNLMFRWFVGLGIADAVWVPAVFTKNRGRLLTSEMSRKVMAAILAHREVAPLRTRACGRAERCAALEMVHRHPSGSARKLTLEADKGYNAAASSPTCARPV